MARADQSSLERKKTEIYSDFTNNFEMNPFSGLLARVTNEESVKRSLINIVLTQIGERFYDSNKGSKITHALFENYDIGSIEVIRIQLNEAVKAYEPRAIIHQINVDDTLDDNGYGISIVFSIQNIPDQTFAVNVPVKRVR